MLMMFVASVSGCRTNEFYLKEGATETETAALYRAIDLVNNHLGCKVVAINSESASDINNTTVVLFRDYVPEQDGSFFGMFWPKSNMIEIRRPFKNSGVDFNAAILVHEIGHSLGLLHVEEDQRIMSGGIPHAAYSKTFNMDVDYTEDMWAEFAKSLSEVGITCDLYRD